MSQHQPQPSPQPYKVGDALDGGNVAPRLGEFEELTLLAIKALQEEAYGTSVGQRLQQAGRIFDEGALYVTLSRLEKKGLAKSHKGKASPVAGGRVKRYFVLTEIGQGALDAAERVRALLRGTAPRPADASFHAHVPSIPAAIPPVIEQAKTPALQASSQGITVTTLPKSAPMPKPVPVPPAQAQQVKEPKPRPTFLDYYGSDYWGDS